ncbi:hypothetical protein CERSUDRAFT_59351 [Gelatoporia subvermispora B]|uniref:Endonuclease/exonuclease/phosphatase domain-containing protein n=1 Tax=Ceriporiopsis subvermispora (strain B) TaxID=914234 RepID=M2Q5A7_CERS8|nr:hypothetical protein CERSUDRAFT_59351 [Gelatoporia subvermispora B]
MWDEERNHHLFTPAALDLAQPLFDRLREFDLHMLLSHGLPTLEASNTKNLTHPDNVFSLEGLLDRLLTCSVLPKHQPPKADHFLIATSLMLPLPATQEDPYCNFQMVIWSEFEKTLRRTLRSGSGPAEITCIDDFEQTRKVLMSALNAAVEKHVPFISTSQYRKQW